MVNDVMTGWGLLKPNHIWNWTWNLSNTAAYFKIWPPKFSESEMSLSCTKFNIMSSYWWWKIGPIKMRITVISIRSLIIWTHFSFWCIIWPARPVFILRTILYRNIGTWTLRVHKYYQRHSVYKKWRHP